LTSPDGLQKALLCTRAALEKKAIDLVVIDVAALTSITDYVVICSGRSDRQVQSIAQAIEEALKAERTRPISLEGMRRGQWVLLDYGDVVVHVFYQPVREFYDLERLWEHAPRVRLPEPLRSQALVGR
jgi:ribosome silencing factor RsfS/YbeB/iojap